MIEAGIEGYEVDARRNTSTSFDASQAEQAVREAQREAPGYSYAGFCAKVKAAVRGRGSRSGLDTHLGYWLRVVSDHISWVEDEGRTARLHRR